jgi:hypothetical protein
MKTRYLLALILMLIVVITMNQTGKAQCPPNRVLMSEHGGFINGGSRTCPRCNTKCVQQNQVQIYLNNRWRIGYCINSCAVLRQGDEQIEKSMFRLSIYPNPAINSAIVFFSLLNNQMVSARVFDLDGKLVATVADGEYQEGDNEIEWNTNAIAAGIYFLQFQSVDEMRTIKLIVNK